MAKRGVRFVVLAWCAVAVSVIGVFLGAQAAPQPFLWTQGALTVQSDSLTMWGDTSTGIGVASDLWSLQTIVTADDWAIDRLTFRGFYLIHPAYDVSLDAQVVFCPNDGGFFAADAWLAYGSGRYPVSLYARLEPEGLGFAFLAKAPTVNFLQEMEFRWNLEELDEGPDLYAVIDPGCSMPCLTFGKILLRFPLADCWGDLRFGLYFDDEGFDELWFHLMTDVLLWNMRLDTGVVFRLDDWTGAASAPQISVVDEDEDGLIGILGLDWDYDTYELNGIDVYALQCRKSFEGVEFYSRLSFAEDVIDLVKDPYTHVLSIQAPMFGACCQGGAAVNGPCGS